VQHVLACGFHVLQDRLAANQVVVRMIEEATEKYPEVTVWESNCLIHGAFGCVKYVLVWGQHLSPMFCTGNLLHLTDYFTKLIAALMNLLAHELDYEIVSNVRREQNFKDILDSLLDRTLDRQKQYSAALGTMRVLHRGTPNEPSRRVQERAELRQRCHDVFNGNISKPRAKHTCVGTSCCKDGHSDCIRSHPSKTVLAGRSHPPTLCRKRGFQ